MALFGLLFAAPVLNVWYTNMLPKLTTSIFSSAALKPYSGPIPKMICGVFLDQTAFAASFLVCFFVIMDYVDNGNFKNSRNNLREKFWPTMVMNWKIWPAAQVINLSVVPIPYRVLYANAIGLFWNCYLSYAQYKTPAPK